MSLLVGLSCPFSSLFLLGLKCLSSYSWVYDVLFSSSPWVLNLFFLILGSLMSFIFYFFSLLDLKCLFSYACVYDVFFSLFLMGLKCLFSYSWVYDVLFLVPFPPGS